MALGLEGHVCTENVTQTMPQRLVGWTSKGLHECTYEGLVKACPMSAQATREV